MPLWARESSLTVTMRFHSRWQEFRDFLCQQCVVRTAFTPKTRSLDFVNDVVILDLDLSRLFLSV